MPEQTQPRSPFQEMQERLAQLLVAARAGFDRQRPGVLEKAAASARNIAERLDNMAQEARRDQSEHKAARSPGTSEVAPEPSDEPPAPAEKPLNANS